MSLRSPANKYPYKNKLTEDLEKKAANGKEEKEAGAKDSRK
jgi:hypothetical protein